MKKFLLGFFLRVFDIDFICFIGNKVVFFLLMIFNEVFKYLFLLFIIIL